MDASMDEVKVADKSRDPFTSGVGTMLDSIAAILDWENDEEVLIAMDEKLGLKEWYWEPYKDYKDVIATDDKDQFLGYIGVFSPYAIGCRGYFYPSRFFLVCEAFAYNIAKAMLQGEYDGFKVNLNVPFKDGYYPLHKAAANFSYEFLELFLAHGARTDVRTKGPMIVEGLLPLNVAVEDTCLPLGSWTKKDSVLKLIVLLSLPDMKMLLDCVSLLAQSTDQTFEELLNYVEQGKLLQMAVLFVAAHKQIRDTTLHDQDGKSISAMEVILKRIDDVVLFLNRQTGEIPVKPKNGLSLKTCKAKMEAMALARVMFQLIEKIGDNLDEFRQNVDSGVPHWEAVEYVTSLFAREGFLVKQKDYNLISLEWRCSTDDRQVGKPEGLLGSSASVLEDVKPSAWQPIYGSNFGFHGVSDTHRDLGNKRRAKRSQHPRPKIKFGTKGTVPRMPREYATISSFVLKALKHV